MEPHTQSIGPFVLFRWGETHCRVSMCMQVKNINLEQRLMLARLLVALANEDKPAVVKLYKTMGGSCALCACACVCVRTCVCLNAPVPALESGSRPISPPD